MRSFRLLFMCALCLLLVSCPAKPHLPSGNGRGGLPYGYPGTSVPSVRVQAPTLRLFNPLDAGATVTLGPAEALALVKTLSPASQGLNSWRDMGFALSQSLSFARGKSGKTVAIDRPGLTVTWEEITSALTLLESLLPQLDANPTLLATSFRWLRIGPDFDMTGYYEPTLEASRTPTKGLDYPLYKVPGDLKSGKAYYTREEIDRQGKLKGRNLEIAYVDETDAYFLHVQGSGRLRFPDGSTSHVLYANKNNRAYNSLGRIMREQGLLPEGGSNMKAIRAWLTANPERRSELFDQNPSYVFFREASRGPLGSMGRPLTPWVSTAVDRRVLPQGTLVMISVPLPDLDGAHTRPFHALTLPQDSGGAIKGNRMDLFCGPGDIAAHIAGHLDTKGAVYLLLPK